MIILLLTNSARTTCEDDDVVKILEQLYLPNPCIIRLRVVDPQTAGLSGPCDQDPWVVSTRTVALSTNTAHNRIAILPVCWSGVCEKTGVVVGVGGAVDLNNIIPLGRSLPVLDSSWTHSTAL